MRLFFFTRTAALRASPRILGAGCLEAPDVEAARAMVRDVLAGAESPDKVEEYEFHDITERQQQGRRVALFTILVTDGL